VVQIVVNAVKIVRPDNVIRPREEEKLHILEPHSLAFNYLPVFMWLVSTP
jgi:hypothetical protein